MQCSTIHPKNYQKTSLLRAVSCNNINDASQRTKSPLAATTFNIPIEEAPRDIGTVIFPYHSTTLGCVYNQSLLIAVKLPRVTNVSTSINQRGSFHSDNMLSRDTRRIDSNENITCDISENIKGLTVHYLIIPQNEQGPNDSVWNSLCSVQCEEPSVKEWTPSYLCAAAVNRKESNRNDPSHPEGEGEIQNIDETVSDREEKELLQSNAGTTGNKSKKKGKSEESPMIVCMPPITGTHQTYCGGNNENIVENPLVYEGDNEIISVVALWAMQLNEYILGVDGAVQGEVHSALRHDEANRTFQWKKVYLHCTTAKRVLSKVCLKSDKRNKTKDNQHTSSVNEEVRNTLTCRCDSNSDLDKEEEEREVTLLRGLIDGWGTGTVQWHAVMPPCDPYDGNAQLFLVLTTGDEKVKATNSRGETTDIQSVSETTNIKDIKLGHSKKEVKDTCIDNKEKEVVNVGDKECSDISISTNSTDGALSQDPSSTDEAPTSNIINNVEEVSVKEGIYIVSLDFNSMSIFIVGKCENPNETLEKYKESPTVSNEDNAAKRRQHEAATAWDKMLDLESCSVWIACGTSRPTISRKRITPPEKLLTDRSAECDSRTLVAKYNSVAKQCASSCLTTDRYGDRVSPRSRTSLNSQQIRIDILQKTREEEAEINRELLYNGDIIHYDRRKHLHESCNVQDYTRRTKESFRHADSTLDSTKSATNNKEAYDRPVSRTASSYDTTTNDRASSLPLTIVIAGGHSKSTSLANRSVLLLTSDTALSRLHVFGRGTQVEPIDVLGLFASKKKTTGSFANDGSVSGGVGVSLLGSKLVSVDDLRASFDSKKLLCYDDLWNGKGDIDESQRKDRMNRNRSKFKELTEEEKITERNLSTEELRDSLEDTDINTSGTSLSSSSGHSTCEDVDDPQENIFDIKNFLLNTKKTNTERSTSFACKDERTRTPSYATALRRSESPKTSVFKWRKSGVGKRKINSRDDGTAPRPLQALTLLVISNAPPCSTTSGASYLYKYDRSKSSLLWIGSVATYQLTISNEIHPQWSKLPIFRSKKKYASAHIPDCVVLGKTLPLGVYGMDEKLYLIIHVIDDSSYSKQPTNVKNMIQFSTLYIVISGDAPAKTRRVVVWRASNNTQTNALMSKSRDIPIQSTSPLTLPEIDKTFPFRPLRPATGKSGMRRFHRIHPHASSSRAAERNLPYIIDGLETTPRSSKTVLKQSEMDITMTRHLLNGRKHIAELSPRYYPTQSRGTGKNTKISVNSSTFSVVEVLQEAISDPSITEIDFSRCPVTISCGDIFYIIHTIQNIKRLDTLNISSQSFGQIETKLILEDLIGRCPHIKSVVANGTKFSPQNMSADLKNEYINKLMKKRDASYTEEKEYSMKKMKERKYQRVCVKIIKNERRNGICAQERSKVEGGAMLCIGKTFFNEARAFLAMLAEYKLNSLFLKEYYRQQYKCIITKLEIICHQTLSELFSEEIEEFNKMLLSSRVKWAELVSRQRKQEEVRIRRQLAQERREQSKLDSKIREMERACLHVIDVEEKSERNEIVAQKEQWRDVMHQCYCLLMRLYHLRMSNERVYGEFLLSGEHIFKQSSDAANKAFINGRKSAIRQYEKSIYDQARKYQQELDELKLTKQNTFDYAAMDVVRWLRAERLKSRLAIRKEPPKLFLESAINEVVVTEDSVYAQNIPIATGITVTPVLPFYMKNRHHVIFEEDEVKPEAWIQLKSSIHMVKIVVTVKETTPLGNKPLDHVASPSTLTSNNSLRSSSNMGGCSQWPITIRAFADRHPNDIIKEIAATRESIEREWAAYQDGTAEYSLDGYSRLGSIRNPAITLTHANEPKTSPYMTNGPLTPDRSLAYDLPKPPQSYNPSHHIPIFSCPGNGHLKVQGHPFSNEGATIVNTRTGGRFGTYRITALQEHIVELIGSCTEENIHSILQSFSVLPAENDMRAKSSRALTPSSNGADVPISERAKPIFQERLFQLKASIEVMLRVPPELVDIAHLTISETESSIVTDSHESSLRPSPRNMQTQNRRCSPVDNNGRSCISEGVVPQAKIEYVSAEVEHSITIHVLPAIITIPHMVIAEKDKDGNFLAKKVDSSGYFNPKEMTYTEMSGPQPYLKHASFNANCNPYIIPYLPKSILTVQMYPTLDPFDSFQFGSGFTIEERPVWQDPRPASSSRTNEVSRVVASDEHSLLISNNKSIRTSNPNSPTPSQMALDPLCCDSFFSGRMPTKHVLVHKGVVLATLLDPGPLRYDVSNTAQSRYRGRRSTISRANSTASTTYSPPTLIIDGVMGSVCYGNISPGKSSNAANGTNSNSPKRKDKNKEDSAALRKAEAMRQAIIAQNNARRREIISFQMQMQQQKQRTSSVLKLQLNEKATGDTVIQIVRALQFLNNSLMPVESPRDIVVGLSLFTPVSLSTGTLTNWTPSLPGSHFCGGTGAIAMTLATVPSANEKVKALSVHSFATVTIDLERTDDPVVIDLWMDTVGHHFPHPIPAAHQCFVPECKGEDCYIGSIGLVYNSKFTTFTGGYLNIAVSEGYNKDKEYIDFKPKTEGVYDEAPLDLNALDHMNIENDSTKDRLSLEGDQVFYGDKLVAILDRRAGEKNNFHDPERSTSYCSTIIKNKQRPLSLSSLNTPKRLHKSGNQKRCDTLEQSSPYMVGSTLDLNSISEGGKLTFYFIKKDDRYEGLPDSDVSSEFGEKSLAVTLEGFKTKQAAHNRSTDNITYGNMRHQRRPSTTSSSDFQSVCVSDLVEPSCLVIPPGYVPVECSLEIVQEIIRNVTFSSRVLTSSDNNYMNSDVPLTSTVTGERSIVYELSCGSCKPVYAHTKLKQSGPLITITSKETYMTHGENAGPCPILKDVNTSNDEGWDGGFVVLECVKGFNHLTDTLSLISEEKGSGKGISLIKKTKLVESKRSSSRDLRKNRFKTTASAIVSLVQTNKNLNLNVSDQLRTKKPSISHLRLRTLVELKNTMLQQATKSCSVSIETDTSLSNSISNERSSLACDQEGSHSILTHSSSSVRSGLGSVVSQNISYDLYYAKLDKVIGTVEVNGNVLTIHFHRFTEDGTPIVISNDLLLSSLLIDDPPLPGPNPFLHNGDITTILRKLTYESTDQNPQDLTRIFKITVNDGRPQNSSATCQLELLTNDCVTEITLMSTDPDEPVQYRALNEKDNGGFCFLDDVLVTDPDTFHFNESVIAVECIGGHDITDTICILSEEQQLAHKRQLIYKYRLAYYQQMMLKYQQAELIRAAAQTAASLNASKKVRKKKSEPMPRDLPLTLATEPITIDVPSLQIATADGLNANECVTEKRGSMGNEFSNFPLNPPKQDDPENDFDIESFRRNELVTVVDVPNPSGVNTTKGRIPHVSVVCVGRKPIGIIQYKKGAPTYTINVGISASMENTPNTHEEAEEAFDNWQQEGSIDWSCITDVAEIDFPCVPISVIQRIFHVTSFKSIHQCPHKIRGGNRIFEIKVGIGKVIGKLRMTVNVQPSLITQLFAPQSPQVTFKNGGEPCKLFPDIILSIQEQSSYVKGGFVTIGIVIPCDDNNKSNSTMPSSLGRSEILGSSHLSVKSTETAIHEVRKSIDIEMMNNENSEHEVFVENTDQVTMLISGMASIFSDRSNSNHGDAMQKGGNQATNSNRTSTIEKSENNPTSPVSQDNTNTNTTPAGIDTLLYDTLNGSDSKVGVSGNTKCINTNLMNSKDQKSLVDPSQFNVIDGSQLYYKKDFIGVVTYNTAEQTARPKSVISQCQSLVRCAPPEDFSPSDMTLSTSVTRDKKTSPLPKPDKALSVSEPVLSNKETEEEVSDVPPWTPPCISSITISFDAASKATVEHVEALCRLCAYQSISPSPSVRRRTAFVDLRLDKGLDGKGCVPLQVIRNDYPIEIHSVVRTVLCNVDGGPVPLMPEARVRGDSVLEEPSFVRFEVSEVGNKQSLINLDIIQKGIVSPSVTNTYMMKSLVENPELAGEYLYLCGSYGKPWDARVMTPVADAIIDEESKARALADEENRTAFYVYNDMFDDIIGSSVGSSCRSLSISQIKWDMSKLEHNAKGYPIYTNDKEIVPMEEGNHPFCDNTRRLVCKVIRHSPNCIVFKLVKCNIDELQLLTSMIMYNAFTPCPMPNRISDEYAFSNSVCPVANSQRALRITCQIGTSPAFYTAVKIHVMSPMLTLFPPLPSCSLVHSQQPIGENLADNIPEEQESHACYAETILQICQGPPIPIFPYLDIDYRNFPNGVLFVISLLKPPEKQTNEWRTNNLLSTHLPVIYNSLNVDIEAADRANNPAIDTADSNRALLIRSGYEVELKPAHQRSKKIALGSDTQDNIIATSSPEYMIVVSRSLAGHLCTISHQRIAGIIYGTEKSRVYNKDIGALASRPNTLIDIRSHKGSITESQLPTDDIGTPDLLSKTTKINTSSSPSEIPVAQKRGSDNIYPLYIAREPKRKISPIIYAAETTEEEEAMVAVANAPGVGVTLKRVLQRVFFTSTEGSSNGSIAPVYLTVVDIGSGMANTYTTGVRVGDVEH